MTESLEQRVENLEKHREVHKTRIDGLVESIEYLEKEVEKLREQNERLRSKLVGSGELERELSDAERILVGDWDSVSANRTKNRERALEIISNWEDMSRMNRSDSVESSLTMKTVVEEMDIEYKTAERVFEFIDEMTNGKIVFDEDTNSLGQVDDLVTDLDDI